MSPNALPQGQALPKANALPVPGTKGAPPRRQPRADRLPAAQSQRQTCAAKSAGRRSGGSAPNPPAAAQAAEGAATECAGIVAGQPKAGGAAQARTQSRSFRKRRESRTRRRRRHRPNRPQRLRSRCRRPRRSRGFSGPSRRGSATAAAPRSAGGKARAATAPRAAAPPPRPCAAAAAAAAPPPPRVAAPSRPAPPPPRPASATAAAGAGCGQEMPAERSEMLKTADRVAGPPMTDLNGRSTGSQNRPYFLASGENPLYTAPSHTETWLKRPSGGSRADKARLLTRFRRNQPENQNYGATRFLYASAA